MLKCWGIWGTSNKVIYYQGLRGVETVKTLGHIWGIFWGTS